MRNRAHFVRITILLIVSIVLLLPQFAAAANQNDTNRYNIVMILDASGSMQKTDPDKYRYQAINQFTDLLAEKGNVLGDVVFSTEIDSEVSPFNIQSRTDKDRIIRDLESVPATGNWTNIGLALSEAIDQLDRYGDTSLPSVIVFLSDGNTDMSTKEAIEESLEIKADALQLAREKGIRIYTVCLNANNDADVSEMEQISKSTEGMSVEIHDASDLKDAFSMFYNLIYGTSTIPLPTPDSVPENGILETEFEVPGFGVEEVNIIIQGKVTDTKLFKPNGDLGEVEQRSDSTYTSLKLKEIIPGKWMLQTRGIPGDHISIDMIYNTNLTVEVGLDASSSELNSNESVTIFGVLKAGSEIASDADQYNGFNAVLQVSDQYHAIIDSVPMQVNNNRFEVVRKFDEGSYFFTIVVTGNHLEKTSEGYGPVTFSEINQIQQNTPPVAKKARIEADVLIWPMHGGSYTLDMTTLAKDKEDSKLHYEIVSSSFIENDDYSVTGDTLQLDHFSLRKGAFTIRATDSGGLFCDIEVIVKSHNVGTIALVGIAIAGLITLAVLLLLLRRAIGLPFRGSLALQSYNEGETRNDNKDETELRRGRFKLSRFAVDNIGLDPTKSYFQATSKRFVYFVTDKPVSCYNKQAKKIKVDSGTIVTVRSIESPDRTLTIRFTSKMPVGPQRTRSRSGARRPSGQRPQRPTGRR